MTSLLGSELHGIPSVRESGRFVPVEGSFTIAIVSGLCRLPVVTRRLTRRSAARRPLDGSWIVRTLYRAAAELYRAALVPAWAHRISVNQLPTSRLMLGS